METINIGMIGMGGIARCHILGWQESPFSNVVAISDIDETKLFNWKSVHQINKIYKNPDELIADKDIDVIDICLPNNLHAEYAIKAMESGKHVLCEKPLASSSDEIQKMIRVRDNTGKKLMCAQHERFKEISNIIKIHSETISPIYHARCWMLRRNELPGPAWNLLKENKGGALFDIGVHVLDLALYFMGNPKPISVTGIARNELANKSNKFTKWSKGYIDQVAGIDNTYEYDPLNIPKVEVEEFGSAFVKFDNGASLILEASWMLNHDVEGEDQQIWLYGKKGGLQWPKCLKITSQNDLKYFSKEILETAKLENTLRPYIKECMHFAEAVVNDKSVLVPAEEAFTVMKILESVHKSNDTGREVLI